MHCCEGADLRGKVIHLCEGEGQALNEPANRSGPRLSEWSTVLGPLAAKPSLCHLRLQVGNGLLEARIELKQVRVQLVSQARRLRHRGVSFVGQ